MFRVIKESETVDARQHCFLLQSSPPDAAPRYLSVETRQELLRIENSWNSTIITSIIKLGVSITECVLCVHWRTFHLTFYWNGKKKKRFSSEKHLLFLIMAEAVA